MLKPMEGYVVVKPDELKTKTKSGLDLPETAQLEVCMGTVEASTEFYQDYGNRVANDIKTGDRVIYRRFAGFEYQGKLILSLKDLVATDN